MKRIHVHGFGAVSPAGWGALALSDAVKSGTPAATAELARPGQPNPLRVRRVPAPAPRPAFLGHPRLRRASPISQYAVGAALEALGPDAGRLRGGWRVGIVYCVMAGCVGYSRRFLDETLRDPSTASPLVFPETVFNAPASHLAAVLESRAINYTLVGDSGTFLQGLGLAAEWLQSESLDGCLVVGAEECDWLTADALRLFSPTVIAAEGAAALYLRADAAGARAELASVTDGRPFTSERERQAAAAALREELTATNPGALFLGTCDPRTSIAWAPWPTPVVRPAEVLGEAFVAGAGWQCVLAGEHAARSPGGSAAVAVVGPNEQVAGAHFVSPPLP